MSEAVLARPAASAAPAAFDPDRCLHEARHAVVAALLGHGVATVSVRRRGRSAGRCLTRPPLNRDEFRVAIELCQIKLAGGGDDDIDEARKIAAGVTRSPAEAVLLLGWLTRRVHDCLQTDDVRQAVSRLADYLRQNGEVDLRIEPERDTSLPTLRVVLAREPRTLQVVRDSDGNVTSYVEP